MRSVRPGRRLRLSSEQYRRTDVEGRGRCAPRVGSTRRSHVALNRRAAAAGHNEARRSFQEDRANWPGQFWSVRPSTLDLQPAGAALSSWVLRRRQSGCLARASSPRLGVSSARAGAARISPMRSVRSACSKFSRRRSCCAQAVMKPQVTAASSSPTSACSRSASVSISTSSSVATPSFVIRGKIVRTRRATATIGKVTLAAR